MPTGVAENGYIKPSKKNYGKTPVTIKNQNSRN